MKKVCQPGVTCQGVCCCVGEKSGAGVLSGGVGLRVKRGLPSFQEPREKENNGHPQIGFEDQKSSSSDCIGSGSVRGQGFGGWGAENVEEAK